MLAAVIPPVRGQVLQLLLCAALPLMIPGCGKSGEAAKPAEEGVLILAAASVQDALERIADVLRARGGPNVTVSPGGSNALAQQIIGGAPGDLFLSANQSWADEVAQHGFSAQSVPLLSGQLVLVVPAGNPAMVRGPDDLLGERVRLIALAGEQVPAGMYAEQALKARGLYVSLSEAGRIVRGQNVRFTLAYVERGEVEAGIVYASDANVTSRVRVVFTFDAQDHEPIRYPLVLLKRGKERTAAREVFDFLRSPEAGVIFEQHGFRLLPEAGGQEQ